MLLLSLLLGAVAKGEIANEEIRALLCKICLENSSHDIVYDIRNPFSGCAKGRFYRKTDNKGNLVASRLEVHSGKGCLCILLNNAHGSFAFDPRGRFAFGVIDDAFLWTFDSALTAIHAIDGNGSRYSMGDILYKGKRCLYIKVDGLPLDRYMESIKALDCIEAGKIKLVDSRHAWRSEYIIDAENHFIYRITHRNYANRIIKNLEREPVGFSLPDSSSSLFREPQKLDGLTDDMNAFMSLCRYAEFE